MLTAKQIEIITLDFLLNREPRIKSAEADKLRANLKKDVEKAKKNGWEIAIPFDYS